MHSTNIEQDALDYDVAIDKTLHLHEMQVDKCEKRQAPKGHNKQNKKTQLRQQERAKKYAFTKFFVTFSYVLSASLLEKWDEPISQKIALFRSASLPKTSLGRKIA